MFETNQQIQRIQKTQPIRKTLTTMGHKIACLLILLSLAGYSYAQTTFDELITTGNQKIKDKNYAEAIDNYNKANSLQPNDTAALNGLIKAHTLAENYKEAQDFIDIALSNHPNNPEFILRQGILFNLQGQHDKAIEQFNQAQSQNPSDKLNLQIFLNKASAEIRLDNFTEALNDYNKAIEIDNRNASIYNYRGFTNFRLGYYLDAINDYNNALDLEPNSPLTYYNRGMTYIKLTEKKKACMDFHKACRLGNMNACRMIIAECGGK